MIRSDLNIDRNITQRTLEDIRGILDAAKSSADDQDITLVWFCLNASSSRFESYEADLINDLSVEYEIPFFIVITQCFSNEKGELEKHIESDLPELDVIRILAKDYKLRGGSVPAFGVDVLLSSSILNFNKRKINILETKLDKLQKDKIDQLEKLNIQGKNIVKQYSDKVKKAALVLVIGIPFIHGLCGKMIGKLNHLYGIRNSKRDSAEVISDFVVGAFVTPFMAIPLLNIGVAIGYIETIGETYLEAMSEIDPGQASSEDVMRIYRELAQRKKNVRTKHGRV